MSFPPTPIIYCVIEIFVTKDILPYPWVTFFP